MTTYILVLLVWAGPWANGTSNDIEHIPGFETYESCMKAGELAKQTVKDTVQEMRFVCVEQVKK